MEAPPKKFAGTLARFRQARDRDVEIVDTEGRDDHVGAIAVDPVAARAELDAAVEECEQRGTGPYIPRDSPSSK